MRCQARPGPKGGGWKRGAVRQLLQQPGGGGRRPHEGAVPKGAGVGGVIEGPSDSALSVCGCHELEAGPQGARGVGVGGYRVRFCRLKVSEMSRRSCPGGSWQYGSSLRTQS